MTSQYKKVILFFGIFGALAISELIFLRFQSEDRFLNEGYHGIITKKVTTNRGKWFELKTMTGENYNTRYIPDSLFRISSVGDTAIKKAGTEHITVLPGPH